MKRADIDLEYICTVIGNLAGIPIRLYQGRKQILYHSIVDLPKDPACIYMEELMAIRQHVGYFVTRHFNFYGIVTSGDLRVIIGPSRQMSANDQELRELAFRADVPKEQVADFVLSMKNIVSMPLESVIQILLTLNHVLNGEKLTLADVTLYDDQAELLPPASFSEPIREQTESNGFNNSLAAEQTILTIVRHGDTQALKEWVEHAPAVNPGILAKDQLRQQKNTFIVTTTVVCRAAIRGGMDTQDALALSDSYIRKCELLQNYHAVAQLQYSMILDYTQRVERLRKNSSPSQLVLDVRNYILHHLSEHIRTSDIAAALFVSRSKLSTRFKAETGENLSDFILTEKIEEAKRLLRYTNKQIIAIANYLGFSSQSHFTRTFQKHVLISPAAYRNRNK